MRGGYSGLAYAEERRASVAKIVMATRAAPVAGRCAMLAVDARRAATDHLQAHYYNCAPA